MLKKQKVQQQMLGRSCECATKGRFIAVKTDFWQIYVIKARAGVAYV